MWNYEKFKEELKKYNPEFTDDFLKEVYALRLDFWQWLVENFDNFFDY